MKFQRTIARLCQPVCSHLLTTSNVCTVALWLRLWGSSGTESSRFVSYDGTVSTIAYDRGSTVTGLPEGFPSPGRLRFPGPSAHVNSCGQSQSMPAHGYSSVSSSGGPNYRSGATCSGTSTNGHFRCFLAGPIFVRDLETLQVSRPAKCIDSV